MKVAVFYCKTVVKFLPQSMYNYVHHFKRFSRHLIVTAVHSLSSTAKLYYILSLETFSSPILAPSCKLFENQKCSGWIG